MITNLIFIGLTLLIGLFFLGLEIKFTCDYKKYYSQESKDTQDTIKYLNDQLVNQEKIVNGVLELKKFPNWNWIKEHLEGNYRIQDGVFNAQIKDSRFVLKKYPAALTWSIPRSYFKFIPGILTAIGILGTFWGIQIGLQNINLNSTENFSQLLPSIQQLLDGMRTAFLTSLFGLGSASVFTLILAGSEWARTKTRNDLRKKLDKIAWLKTDADLESNQLTAEAIGKATGTQVRDKIAPLINPIKEELREIRAIQAAQNQLTPQEISQQVALAFAPLINPISEHLREIRSTQFAQKQLTSEAIGQQVALALAPGFTEIRNDLLAQRQTIEQQRQELLTTLIQELRTEVVEPVVLRLDESARLTREASQAVRELKDALGEITQSLAESIQTIQRFQENTLGQLQQFAVDLRQILSQFQTETQGVLQQVATEIQRAVSTSIEGLATQRQAFIASARQAATFFQGIQENLQEALKTQAQQQKEMLAGVESQTINILAEANQAFLTQSRTIETVGVQASSVMDTARTNLEATLNNIDENLQNTRNTVQQELENFRINYQSALVTFFNEQNNLLNDTLGQQRDGLAGVVADLQRVFVEEAEQRKELAAQVNDSMARINGTVQRVSELANVVGLSSSERLAQLIELSRTISGEAQRVERAYQNMGNQFNQALDNWNQQIITYLDQATNSQTTFFNQADNSMAKVCNGLNETANGLLDVSQYLVSAANEARMRK
ncbi:hypothetical protein Cri9333_1884 [Crinalium epipsammum PCC 9333]|uniref:MotA/TolQ/ExbB proton channel domain-containing protein n=1 Tax=Crinalium epipsammum PCC 9333 TaxID=1173022 RepID=K9VZ43_9CYAN|nr:MotA/TolQ/ExbB proton channel family protein [Crinalium epipsammum]AFZ12767.1 hypothetical protein Cri9333_1884 [Crinalium epipsammum PCC 9333]